MTHSNRKSMPAKQAFTNITIQLPQELLSDLQALCQAHKVDFKDDLLARMAFSLDSDDTLMASDRLRRLIFCKQLSYEYTQRQCHRKRGTHQNWGD